MSCGVRLLIMSFSEAAVRWRNGWIIFDDFKWTYGSKNGLREATDGITHRQLSKDEQEIPQIRELFELLVKQHPNYGDLRLLEDEDHER